MNEEKHMETHDVWVNQSEAMHQTEAMCAKRTKIRISVSGSQPDLPKIELFFSLRLSCPVLLRVEFMFRSPKGPVIRAASLLNLPRNTAAPQVETLCCAHHHVRDQPVSQQNIVLQVEATCGEK